MSEITPWDEEFWDQPKPPIPYLSIQLNTTGLNYAHVISICHYYLFYGFKNILKIKDFDKRFSKYIKVNCGEGNEYINWKIEGDIINVWIKASKSASQIKLIFDYKNKTVRMTYQVYDTIEFLGEIDLTKIEFTFGQEKLFKVIQ